MRQGLEIDENPEVFFPALLFLVAPIAFRMPVREHYMNPERGGQATHQALHFPYPLQYALPA